MLANDSILTTTIATANTDTVAVHTAKPQTPYEVLRLLPKDATDTLRGAAVIA